MLYKFMFSVTLISICSLSVAQEKSEIVVTPQRPSFSTSTTTTYPGTFEIESGVTVNPNLFDTPMVIKYGLGSNFEVFMGVSPLIALRGSKQSGFGDIVLGGRYRCKDSMAGSPSYALQAAVKLPTADSNKGLGSGKIDYNLLFILSKAYSSFNIDVNIGGSLIGTSASDNFEEQFTGILTLGHSLGGGVDIFGEIYTIHNFDRGVTEVSATSGFVYLVQSTLALDFALNFNISDAPYDWQILTGATINLNANPGN